MNQILFYSKINHISKQFVFCKEIMILNSSFVLLFGVTLLLQNCNAEPYRDMDAASRAVRERLILLKLVLSEVSSATRSVLKDSVAVAEKMLNDPAIKGVDTDSMKMKLDEFREFMKSYKEFEENGIYDKKTMRPILGKFDDVASKYDEEKNTLENPEDKLIAKYLKENNFGFKYDDRSDELAQSIVDKFVLEAKTYLSKLDDEGKKEESRISEVLDQIAKEKDPKKSGNFMMRLWDEFDLEKFLW